MKCEFCGAALANDDVFCRACGRQQRKARKRFPWGLLCGFGAGLLLLIVLLLTGALSFSGTKLSSIEFQGSGCSSFDELLDEYVDAMRQMDIDRVTALYDCETYADENLSMNMLSMPLGDSIIGR